MRLLDLLQKVLRRNGTLAGYLLLVTAGGPAGATRRKRLPLRRSRRSGVLAGRLHPAVPVVVNPLEIFLCLSHGDRRGDDPAVCTRSLALFTLAAAALFFSLRILLDLRAAGFGAFLLVPGVLLLAVVLLGLFPDLVRAGPARVMATAGTCVLLVFVGLVHVLVTRANFQEAVLEVQTPRGTMRLPPEKFNADLRDLVNYLRTSTPPGSTLAIFPEGLPVNFLAERENPLYFTNYIKVELTQPGVREAVLSDLERKRPDYVAVIWRSESEYGSEETFENGYGGPIIGWLHRHYLPEFSTETALLLRRR
jgi:hypothetical protein